MFIDGECSEEKKANLRKYLEKHGVIQAIAEIFDNLKRAKEKPENPIEFIRKELGGAPVPQETFDKLELELEEAYQEIYSLRNTIEDMGLGKLLEEEFEKLDEPFSADS